MSRAYALLAVVAVLLSAETQRDTSGSTIESAAVQANLEANLQTAERAKLRKLHLVRPDLIPYPVAYAIYC
ncbi:MAG: hypothetical protein ACFCVE_02435 [Phycisphaerae bacterium]